MYIYKLGDVLVFIKSMKRVLILTWSYGSWHNSAASSLWSFIQKNYWYQVSSLDFVEFIWKKMWSFTNDFWFKLIEDFPNVREKVFNFCDSSFFNKLIWKLWYLIQKKFDKKLLEINPDVIIVTIPFWLWFLNENNLKNIRTWVFITDSINIHSSRYSPIIDYYFVIDEKSKISFKEKFNHSYDNIFVSFFPLSRDVFYDKINIDNKKIMLLLTWLKESYVVSLLDIFKDTEYNILIIKWRNDLLYNKLVVQYEKVSNYRFVEFIDIKTSLPDYWIVISKPWWALTAECIATDTIMIMPDYFRGLEVWNLKLLEEHFLGFYEKDPLFAAKRIKELDWKSILWNFKKIKKENSCDIITDILLKNI